MAVELDVERIAGENAKRLKELEDDYEHLGRRLARRGVDIERLTRRAEAFRVAVPSWGVGTGGTRFARFPNPGEPRNIFEKLEDCEVDPEARAHDPRHLAPHPLGQAGPPGRAAVLRPGARPLLRLDELEHLRGPAGPALVVQVRQPQPHRSGGAPTGRGAQPRVPRAGCQAGGSLPHGVDRRRRELSGTEPPAEGARPLPRQHARRSTPPCPRASGCSSSTSCTSRPSTRR